jgi:hypothetical protein
MITRKKNGSRVVELIVPLEPGCNVKHESVTLKPVTLDHVLRWQNGLIAGPMAMLAELSGLAESTLGLLQYPDADIVLQEFSLHLPATIRQAVAESAIPMTGEAPALSRAPVHVDSYSGADSVDDEDPDTAPLDTAIFEPA